MEPFLKSVAKHFYKQYGKEISRRTFVFPSRRAGLFFRMYLSEIAAEPIFSPRITTINDFIIDLSPRYKVIQKQELLFHLYEAFIKTKGNEEKLIDDFLYWGGLILNDFDELDRYLIDARIFFSNLKDYKEFDNSFDYLTEEQKKAIKSFWGYFEHIHARKDADDSNQISKEFNRFWHSLQETYEIFKEKLESENKAYEGMLYRKAAENTDCLDELKEESIFVGLFALSPAELKILSRLKDRNKAFFCWDHRAVAAQDPKSIVHKLLTENIKRLGEETVCQTDSTFPQPVIEVIKCPGENIQAKLLSSLIEEMKQRSGETNISQAVVLPDQALQMAVVAAIPQEEDINITIGYPLHRTGIAMLLNQWYKLLLMRRKSGDNEDYSITTEQVINLLSHKLITRSSPKVAGVIDHIRKQKFFYLKASELEPLIESDELLSNLLKVTWDIDSFFRNLLFILRYLVSDFENTEEAEQEETHAEPDGFLSPFDTEFIYHYLTLAQGLLNQIKAFNIQPDIKSGITMLEELARGFKIPFEGEPLKGLQIMGMLETRVLNFSELIFFSAEDSTLPGNKLISTLIPYTLRAGYGLPVGEVQEAITAYNFFRLIGGADRITFLYNSAGSKGGAVSRYILQLKYLYGYDIRERAIDFEASATDEPVLTVPKTQEIIDKLKEKELSASALHKYIDCPLKFYYEYVEQADEEEVPEILMNEADFGNVVHLTLEKLFENHSNEIITSDFIDRILAHDILLRQTIKEAYLTAYLKIKDEAKKTFRFGELDKLYLLMIEKQVRCILQFDRETEFVYIQGEKKLKGEIVLDEQNTIKIKGYIDRIDKRGDTIRIIDYKSGRIESTKEKNIEDLYNHDKKGEYKPQAQLLFYQELVKQNERELGLGCCNIEPHLYAVRLMQTVPDYSSHIKYSIQDRVYEQYTEELRAFYLERLRGILSEMIDINIPFAQANDAHRHVCGYCPFAISCGRLS